MRRCSHARGSTGWGFRTASRRRSRSAICCPPWRKARSPSNSRGRCGDCGTAAAAQRCLDRYLRDGGAGVSDEARGLLPHADRRTRRAFGRYDFISRHDVFRRMGRRASRRRFRGLREMRTRWALLRGGSAPAWGACACGAGLNVGRVSVSVTAIIDREDAAGYAAPSGRC